MKNFPLLIKCLNSSVIEVMLMETMDTKQVILCLLRLENRYGKIIAISRDSGTNMLAENMNPKTEDETRLFESIKEYTAPVDSQFRNYSERSTGLLKKFMKQMCGIGKTETVPTLLRSEMEFV